MCVSQDNDVVFAFSPRHLSPSSCPFENGKSGPMSRTFRLGGGANLTQAEMPLQSPHCRRMHAGALGLHDAAAWPEFAGLPAPEFHIKCLYWLTLTRASPSACCKIDSLHGRSGKCTLRSHSIPFLCRHADPNFSFTDAQQRFVQSGNTRYGSVAQDTKQTTEAYRSSKL